MLQQVVLYTQLLLGSEGLSGKDGWMDGWMGGQIDRSIDRWMDGWMDR